MAGGKTIRVGDSRARKYVDGGHQATNLITTAYEGKGVNPRAKDVPIV